MSNIKKNLIRVIQSGSYRLSDMLEKIDILWGNGELETADREELYALAKANLKPEQERPDMLEALKRLVEKFESLEERYAAMESRLAAMESRLEALDGNTAETPEAPEEPPLWHPWTGIPGSGYQLGDRVTHNGKVYESIYEAGENVWEPGALGTEMLWQLIE